MSIEELIDEKLRSIVDKFFDGVMSDEDINRLVAEQKSFNTLMNTLLTSERERWIYNRGRISGYIEMLLILEKKKKEAFGGEKIWK